MTHLRQNLCGEESTNLSEFSGYTSSNRFGKVPFWDFVAEQSRAGFFFSCRWESQQFCQHDPGDMQIRRPPWFCVPSRYARISPSIPEKKRKWVHGRIDELHEFSQGRCRVCPRPHIEPTFRRSVGIALYGPAVVHSKAWASSLRVASSGADMDPTNPSTDKAYILKSLSRSTRLFVDSSIFLVL